jgi:hypothetical protein
MSASKRGNRTTIAGVLVNGQTFSVSTIWKFHRMQKMKTAGLVILNFRVLWDSKVWPPQILDLDGDNIFADRRSIVSQATK